MKVKRWIVSPKNNSLFKNSLFMWSLILDRSQIIDKKG